MPDVSMNKEFIPMEEMYPLIAEMLQIKGEVTFMVSGWSMQPMVYHRRDTVTLVKAELPLKKYDLPFYLMDNGKFILHRVIKIHPDGTYECRGDNRWESEDNIRDDQIIGVVKSFNRNGKEYSVNSLGYWFYTRTWVILHHFKWMYNYPKRLKEKIKRDFKHYKITRKLREKVIADSGRTPSPQSDMFRKKTEGGKNMKIEYRAARGSDLKDFYRIFEQFSKKEAADYENPIANTEWIRTENAKQYYNKLRQEQFFWLAVANDEIIGFCTGSLRKVEPLGITVGNLVNILVSEDYRSLGIGTKLVNTFKAYCKENGCNNITVTFMEKNERAEKFYARHGFTTHKRTYYCNFE